MAEPVGIIYGNVGAIEYKFAISGAHVHRNMYVQAEHEDYGTVLGQVADIQRETDLSFDKAQRLGSGEEVAIGEQVSASVSVLGFRDDRNNLQVPRTPFDAGIKVYKASEETIRSILSLKEDKATGAYLGKLKGHDIKIYLDMNSMVQKHCSILARTGGGKSYMLGVLIEEFMKKGVPVVIIDPHGEYSSLMHPNNNPQDLELMGRFEISPRGYADKVVEYSPDVSINKMAIPIRFDEVNLDSKDLADMTDVKKAGSQMGILRRAVKEAAKKKFYIIKDVIKAARKDKNPSKWNVINGLEFIKSIGIFSEPPTRLTDLVREGQATVLNMKGTSPDVQEIVISRIAKKLFLARKLNRIPPMMLVVEEAHNFCPQQGTAMTLGVLKTIASEGRKFGLGLCVVSQRPAKIDKNVLSQCATQIILKVTNPNDLKAIAQSIEGLTHGMEDNIQRLSIGSAILSGGNITTPIIIDVRVRETKHGGESVTIVSPVPPDLMEKAEVEEEREAEEGEEETETGEPVDLKGAELDYDDSGMEEDMEEPEEHEEPGLVDDEDEEGEIEEPDEGEAPDEEEIEEEAEEDEEEAEEETDDEVIEEEEEEEDFSARDLKEVEPLIPRKEEAEVEEEEDEEE